MSLEKSLIELERFCAKAWRIHAKEDPLARLSFNEYDYLRVIEAYPQGVRITDLAEEMKVTKPSASAMVVRLQNKGLVKRVHCYQDARAKRVALTDKVIEEISMEQKVYQQIASTMTAKLSDDEAIQLVQLLTKSLKS
ncbi:MarR family winged helix-turn-helix transcriptional regulator [Vibrio sinaloensis]|uniref:MarR family winged helix-turn-helix transcriptional regulator n=1 Tax=Photobacterium sp. (strain ATCC 43367) TaxID=379097 RepID=UPI00206A0819|nr:MarR family winged helix-turn-helix transcriptional regulator [Vibrio sinaloensis]UPQ88422.1 MarR family winged helix-turn-helix transcriptional regulator [Vibrio sinaloensis]